MPKALFIFLQRLAPQHLLSRLAGALANSNNQTLKNFLVANFIKAFNVDMSEALDSDYRNYPSFNDFFIRKLKAGARPIDSNPATLCCPADGEVSQSGDITEGKIFQAKGREFDTGELLADNESAKNFSRGKFCTIYLSPRDYHRVHMPMSGTLKTLRHIPGNLFSVNQTTSEEVDRLFARNERAVFHFEGDAGDFIVVMVGAMIVASIETDWAGLLKAHSRDIFERDYRDAQLRFEKGDELGRFKLGSTAIVLIPENCAQWEESFRAGAKVKMGDVIGKLN